MIIDLSDVEKLCDAILHYNVVIHTTSGAVNTSDYNIVDFSKNNVGGLPTVIDSTQENGSIMLAYNPNGTNRIGTNELKKGAGYKTMVIPFNTITSYTIESERSFLMQQPISSPTIPFDKVQELENKIAELESKINDNMPKLFPHSDRHGGKLDIQTNDGTVVIEWHQIEQDFGVGPHNVSAQIPLNSTMKEIHSVHVSAMASNGNPWDFPQFQASVINQDQKTIQIMASKGGRHTLHLLVIGKK